MEGGRVIRSGNRSLAELTPQELDIRLPGTRHFAVWLVPAQADHDLLSVMNRDLAAHFNAPLFPPHLTVYLGADSKEDGLAKMLVSLASKLDPIEIQVRGIASSEALFRSIYIELDHQATLLKLSQSIARRLQHRELFTLEPHVSLLYKEISQEERAYGIRQINFDREKITFNALQVARPALHSNGWVDITDWEIGPLISMKHS